MDDLTLKCGDDLADAAVELARKIQGAPIDLTQLELTDRLLVAVSRWWQATDPNIVRGTDG